MRSNAFKEARIGLLVLSLVLAFVLLFYFFASMFTSMGYKKLRDSDPASADNISSITIIIDAGHGGEDPGAVVGEMLEKEINLYVAFALNVLFENSGYSTVMTRCDDVLLYNHGEENKKKYHDLRNREAIADKYEDALFISLHMNKYPLETCNGLQVFYSSNNVLSKSFAESVQLSAKHLQPNNHRIAKQENENIYLLKSIDIPAILVECGFLSNPEENALLKTNEYRTALALSIYCGAVEQLENLK